MGTFSVRVVDERGLPIEGLRVAVTFHGLGGVSTAYTDSDGWVSFDNSDGSHVSGEFFVQGESQGWHSTRGGDSYSFTRDRYG